MDRHEMDDEMEPPWELDPPSGHPVGAWLLVAFALVAVVLWCVFGWFGDAGAPR